MMKYFILVSAYRNQKEV